MVDFSLENCSLLVAAVGGLSDDEEVDDHDNDNDEDDENCFKSEQAQFRC
jgi:hypothetical protein